MGDVEGHRETVGEVELEREALKVRVPKFVELDVADCVDDRQSVVVCDGLDEILRDIVPLGDTDKLALWVAERLCVPVNLGDADTLPEGDRVLLMEVEYDADEDRNPEPLSELLAECFTDAEKLRVKACVVPMAVTDDVTLTEGEATRDLLAMPEALGEGENVRDTLGERDMLGHGDVVAERHSVGDTEGDLDRDAVTLEERDEVSENEGEGD